ncbi:hypothetical protein SLEP1_g29048 [Rubroshorea leprosula]|uniref:Serine hydrolase domain-containing protein n=1 Tax=Rubroshorea leprosula TaxID=152421 RepID=A0AAV5K498_9ROSI|nr:hypothetical protein SLEP1_g29048 [Rubroshorea leprosula]
MQNKMQKKPRILCLHGFRTSAEILKHVIGKTWPEAVLEKLDLHFLDSPFPARARSDVESIFDFLTLLFFHFLSDNPKYRLLWSILVRILKKSIAHIEDYMTKHGPFDGCNSDRPITGRASEGYCTYKSTTNKVLDTDMIRSQVLKR